MGRKRPFELCELGGTFGRQVLLLGRIGAQIEEPAAAGRIADVQLPLVDERGLRRSASPEELFMRRALGLARSLVLMVLMLLILWVGIYPQPLLEVIRTLVIS